MKYIVMQCCKGYAVLMDEESKFVFAANKGYEVGQSVINPVIMTEDGKYNRNITAVIKVISAAAACVALVTGIGYSYYAQNLKTYSVVTITSDSAISMELNKTGKVIRLKSDTDYGKEIIEKSDIKGMDKVTAANEILQTEISDGHISSGDIIDVYITGSSDSETDFFRTELEHELPELDLKVNVHDEKAEPPHKVKPPEKDKDLPVPEKENKEDKAPAAPVTTKAADDNGDKTKPAVSKPVEAPVPPVKEDKELPDIPEPPAAEAEKPVPPETPDKTEPPVKPDKDNIGDKKPVPPSPPHENTPLNHKKPVLNEYIKKDV